MTTRRKLLLGSVATIALGAGGLAGRRLWLSREPDLPPPLDEQGRALWSNWCGLETSYPERRAAPANEAELAAMLSSAPKPIRPVGAGHSFTGLVPTGGTLLSLDQMQGLVGHDRAASTARVWAGTRLSALGPALATIGQEMANLPDINKQTLAGALSTATHGTGKDIGAMHASVIALRLVTPQGKVIESSRDQQPEIFHAARVGLGAFGVITEVELQNRPLKRVKKTVTVVDTEDVLKQWPDLVRQHRNVEFLVIPFTGKSQLITHDETDELVRPRGADTDTEALMQLKTMRDIFEFMPGVRTRIMHRLTSGQPPEVAIDDGWKLLSNERPVRFKEMEYHVPIDEQIGVLREVIARIERGATDVFFPIEARIIAPDDAWLSPFYERPTGSIAVHAFYREAHQWMYDLIEPVFRDVGGRPHWGKLHSLAAADLKSLYPMFGEAGKVRRMLDPDGRMLNAHLGKLFGDA